MCGIAGVVGVAHRDRVRPMTAALAHRGPDGDGFFTDEIAALGHRRLSIIDLEGGRQPMACDADRLQLVCNGEIYNSPELRRQLEADGYRFRTHCDVEVILPLYRRYGRDCVTKLRGMFSFAIWDPATRTLFAARDHMGQKPFFWAHVDGAFLFASEVKGVLASGLLERKPDLDALWHYISLRFLPDERSLFEGVRKLRAGHWLEYRDGEISQGRYWSPQFEPKFRESEDVLLDRLDALLDETVAGHLLSDVDVGVFLSGGIDSSLVAAIAAGHSERRMPSFSIGVRDQSFDELPYARMVARKYGLDAHERIVDADLLSLLPGMIGAMDEPSDPFGFGVYLVSALASEHVKVALSGDGGDENFAGYDRYAGQRIVELYRWLPEVLRRQVVSRLVKAIPESFGYKSLAQKALWLNEMSFHSGGDRYAHSMSFLRFTDEAKQSLFTEGAMRSIDDPRSKDKILAYFEADNASDLVDRMLYTDLMTRMPDHLLALVDRMAMAHSLEVRPALVDYRLVEFAARLPGDFKLHGRELKYLLRKVAARYLPEELVTREKQGFSFPIARWLRTDLKGFTRRLLGQSRFVELGIFSGDYVHDLLEEHLAGKADHNYRLWILINLEIWYLMYFEGMEREETSAYIRRLLDEPVPDLAAG